MPVITRFFVIEMVGTEQIRDLQQRVETLGRCIDIDGKRADVAARQEKTLAADFWDDPKEAEKFLKDLAGVKFWVTGFDKVADGVEDLNVLLDFDARVKLLEQPQQRYRMLRVIVERTVQHTYIAYAPLTDAL